MAPHQVVLEQLLVGDRADGQTEGCKVIHMSPQCTCPGGSYMQLDVDRGHIPIQEDFNM